LHGNHREAGSIADLSLSNPCSNRLYDASTGWEGVEARSRPPGRRLDVGVAALSVTTSSVRRTTDPSGRQAPSGGSRRVAAACAPNAARRLERGAPPCSGRSALVGSAPSNARLSHRYLQMTRRVAGAPAEYCRRPVRGSACGATGCSLARRTAVATPPSFGQVSAAL
jgi:hypothetical protein